MYVDEIVYVVRVFVGMVAVVVALAAVVAFPVVAAEVVVAVVVVQSTLSSLTIAILLPSGHPVEILLACLLVWFLTEALQGPCLRLE